MGTEPDRGRWVFSHILVPCIVSGVTAVLVVLALGWDGGHRPAPDPGERRGDVETPAESPVEDPVAEAAAATEENRKAIEELREAVTVGGDPDMRLAMRDPKQYTSELISRLSETRSEQHFVIEATLISLARIGDGAVPEILEKLRGPPAWGKPGGIARQGPVIKGYNSERLVLMDALRQIGTPASKEGLLNIVRENGKLSDLRNLLAMYQGTRDAQMIEGIRKLLPGMLDTMKEMGFQKMVKEAGYLLDDLGWWFRTHGAAGLEDSLIQIVEQGFRAGQGYRVDRTVPTVVETSPEKAAVMLRRLHAADPKGRAIPMFARAIWTTRDRSRTVRVCEILLAGSDLGTPVRQVLYSNAATHASYELETSAEKAADLEVVRSFLEKRMGIETDAGLRKLLQKQINRVEVNVKKLTDDS